MPYVLQRDEYKKTIQKHNKNIALYQGNIACERLNFPLLQELARRLPEWEFWFCSKTDFLENTPCELFSYPNVQYLGNLHPEELREKAYESTVGIILFYETEILTGVSFPLKAFEYLACGLPVSRFQFVHC